MRIQVRNQGQNRRQKYGRGSLQSAYGTYAPKGGYPVFVPAEPGPDRFGHRVSHSGDEITEHGCGREEHVGSKSAEGRREIGHYDVVSAAWGIFFTCHGLVHQVTAAAEHCVSDNYTGHASEQADGGQTPDRVSDDDAAEDEEVKELPLQIDVLTRTISRSADVSGLKPGST
jgi:hypothetical protein